MLRCRLARLFLGNSDFRDDNVRRSRLYARNNNCLFQVFFSFRAPLAVGEPVLWVLLFAVNRRNNVLGLFSACFVDASGLVDRFCIWLV